MSRIWASKQDGEDIRGEGNFRSQDEARVGIKVECAGGQRGPRCLTSTKGKCCEQGGSVCLCKQGLREL